MVHPSFRCNIMLATLIIFVYLLMDLTTPIHLITIIDNITSSMCTLVCTFIALICLLKRILFMLYDSGILIELRRIPKTLLACSQPENSSTCLQYGIAYTSYMAQLFVCLTSKNA